MKKAIFALLSITFLTSGFLEAAKPKTSSKYTRVYNKPLSAQNKKDISYIVKTLGLGSMAKIISSKSSLKKAGDRIRPVHPLQVLAFVFTNEELKAAAHNIRKSHIPFVWSEFWSGLRDSLAEESKNGNLTSQQIADFSKTVGINPSVITPSIQAHNWQEFFDLLLTKIPRNENAGRYNI